MTPVHANRNGLWDRVLVDALVACGVRRVVLCPGGRNGLLAMTLHRTPGVECILHVDERSGGFVAVGAMLADGRPTAVCTTSGSAVANLLPAMAEAEARALPLILLTCDRPIAGRRDGEPQTLPQTALCAPLARVQMALPDPFDDDMDMQTLQCRVVAALTEGIAGARPGPVQINIPQWGAYCATEDDASLPISVPPPPPPPPRVAMPGPRETGVEAIVDALHRCGGRPGLRGLVLACEDQPLSIEAVAGLLGATGYPLIADACSGLRGHALPGMMTTADLLAEGEALDLGRIDLLIRLGGVPVSPGLSRAIRRVTCPVIRFAAHDAEEDFLTPHAICLAPPSPKALDAMALILGRGDFASRETWLATERIAAATRDIVVGASEWGEMAAAAVVVAAPGFDLLHCANSLSVRHAGLLMGARDDAGRMFSARGVNGTDGTLGLLLGEALACARDGRLLALIGDQAFVHDLPALANPLWRERRGAICVMNNGGGGLFDLTPARRIEDFGATMRNAPTVDISGIATAFAMTYARCADREALGDALARAACGDRLHLIDIAVPPGTPLRDLPRLIRAVRLAVG